MLMKMETLYKRNMITATATTTTNAAIRFWFILIIAVIIISQTKCINDNQATISAMDFKSINITREYKNNNNNNNDGEVTTIRQQPNQENSASNSDTESEDSFEPSDCITIREHKECFVNIKGQQSKTMETPSIINKSKATEEEEEEEEEPLKIKYAKQVKGEKQGKYVQKNGHKLESSTTAITAPLPLKGTKETAITSAGQRKTQTPGQAQKQMKMLTLAKTGREILAPYTGNLKASERSLATTITKSPSPQKFHVQPQEDTQSQYNENEKNGQAFIRGKAKLTDQLKLQEIVTDDNNHSSTTTTTTESNNAALHKIIKPHSGHETNINPTNHSDILSGATEVMAPHKISDTTIKTEWHRSQGSLLQTQSMVYNDFTGKLLAEKDGAIKEIEQKFRLKEFLTTTTAQNRNKEVVKDKELETVRSTLVPLTKLQATKIDRVQHAITKHYNTNNKGQIIMEKRVKKSFEFPMHISFNAPSNRKFISSTQQKAYNFLTPTKSSTNVRNQSEVAPLFNKLSTPRTMVGRFQPEFSTTKFYNSKELYHERQQNIQMENKFKKGNSSRNDLKRKRTTKIVPNSKDPLKLNKILDLQNLSEYVKKLNIKRINDGRNQTNKHNANKSKIKKFYNKTKISLDDGLNTTRNFHLVPTTTNANAYSNNNILSTVTPKTKRGLTSTNDYTKITSATQLSTVTTTLPAHTALVEVEMEPVATKTYYNNINTDLAKVKSTNSSKLNSIPRKSTIHSNNLNFLREKISSLKCDLQMQTQGLQIWRSNTTHELILPKMTPENCKIDMECSAMMVSWEGESEIQSGDILIIEINDTLLSPKEIITNISDNKSHNVQVYQVTRSGHEHCDVTEGILLDITPLILDDRKLVTLYDKDLTEGVNFLIVVYEGWGSQCVRLKVTTKTDNCGENSDCSAKGLCYSTSAMEEYECQCCSGFSGSHCEEIDACTPSPCTNNGICVDLSQGHEGNSYQCLCPYGYSGKNCQYELDPCNPTECMNGGSCVGNSTHFRCECLPGFIGPLCQHSLNKCESSPCIHGICVNQEDGFRCFCQPGFAGELCNFEYNECESNPCLNQGECIDHIGSYECRCTKGYTGSRCQIKVDFCANKPCPLGHNCLDHGNDYSCECPGGHNGPDCNEIQRMQCNVNPCTHGGTCWSSGDSFYCACRPGYTGTMCEDEYVVETVISSSEFIVDDNSARNFNDKTYDSAVVIKSPIVLHNAYFAAAVLAATIFIVAIVLTICHCKVNQTYRKFSTRSYGFIPILGFGRRQQIQNKFNKHWLSGKNVNLNGNDVGGNRLRSAAAATTSSITTATATVTTAIRQHNLNSNNCINDQTMAADILHNNRRSGQLHERPFQRHMPLTNIENDMYYTVDFGETTQHAPLIQ